jgi:hypothetical protein
MEARMRRYPATVLAFVTMTMASASPEAQSPSLRVVMQEKAQNAQGVLKPLVLADFASIEQYATQLGRLTYTEVASWQAQPNSLYREQASTFLKAIEDLGQAAQAHDVQRAAVAYASLVSSCVNCHQLVGARQSVSLVPPAPILDLRYFEGYRQ